MHSDVYVIVIDIQKIFTNSEQNYMHIRYYENRIIYIKQKYTKHTCKYFDVRFK